MDLQVEKNPHLRHLLLFEFNCEMQKNDKPPKATEITKKICQVYGKDFISLRTAQKWIARFKEGNFELKDQLHTGRPSEFDEQCLEELIRQNSRQTTRELADQIGCSPQTILNHLNAMGKVQKYGSWVPHKLSQENKDQRVNICASLLARHRQARDQHRPFLSQIITGDEKWCLYINIRQRKEWASRNEQATSRVKPDLHPKKSMLCIWWDMKGIVHHELLRRNQTINAEVYSAQLHRLDKAILQNRPDRHHNVLLQHDNARPHTARLTKMALEELGWEVLPHPPYSPDLAPSDYYLFRSLSNALKDISFDKEDELQNWLHEWFASKPSRFFKQGFEKLPCRWEEVISNGGDYIID